MSVPISDANVIYRHLAPDVEFQLTLGWGISPKVKQIATSGFQKMFVS